MPTERASVLSRFERLATLEASRGVHGATSHHWKCAPTWSSAHVTMFEKRRSVSLPAQYKAWLTEVGSSGAGPGYGLFEPGTWNLGRLPVSAWTARQFGPLAKPFPYETAIPRHAGPIAGAMPICDFGCGRLGVLVTAGPQRGQIWIDLRKDCGGGFEPEDGLHFSQWIEAWLTEAEYAAANPPVVRPKHPNAPDVMLPARSIISETAEAELREDTLRRLRSGASVKLGALGSFVLRGAGASFDQGPALAAALSGEPLPDVGAMTKLFAALVAAPSWTGIEVPGLFTAWVRESVQTPFRDYLGRPSFVGEDGRFFTVSTSAIDL